MTLAQTPSSRYYQGWKYDYDETRPTRSRWQATRRGDTVTSTNETGLKQRIDDAMDGADAAFKEQQA